MDNWLLFGGGVLMILLSVRMLRQRWSGRYDEERMVRQGASRSLVTALGAIAAATPLGGVVMILSTDWSLQTAGGRIALAILFPTFIALECSLFFFMFPRFLVPPPIRHRQSLASRADHGP